MNEHTLAMEKLKDKLSAIKWRALCIKDELTQIDNGKMQLLSKAVDELMKEFK